MRSEPAALTLLLVSCASAPATGDPVVRARDAVRHGELERALDLLAEPSGAGVVTRILSSEELRALTDDPESRALLRALVERRASESRLTMVRASEPGEPLDVTITVVDRRSRAPVAGARVDLMQVDASGRYEPAGETGPFNPRLFGSAITDAAGRIEVTTIRPSYYTEDYGVDEPAHIHFWIRVDGGLRRAAEFFFADDPRLTDAFRRAMARDPRPVAAVERTGSGWRAEVTIPIGRTARRR